MSRSFYTLVVLKVNSKTETTYTFKIAICNTVFSHEDFTRFEKKLQ